MHRRLALCTAVLLIHAWTASAEVQHFAFGLDRSLTYNIQQGDQIIAEGVAPGPAGNIAFATDDPFPILIYPSGVAGDFTPPARVTDLHVEDAGSRSVTLSWTAVGDDGTDGQASAYDLRYATFPITALTWQTAARAEGEPAPAAAGAAEAFAIEDLAPGTTYYFALQVADEVPNWSGLSNVVSGTTETIAGDSAPPAAVDDLIINDRTRESLILQWTAVGDDGDAGQASLYDLRYATSPINEQTWGSATRAEGEPDPREAGGDELYALTGLEAGTLYYIALKVGDEVPNWSALSNVVIAGTSPPPDFDPPGAVGDLQVAATDTNSVVLTWTAVGDDGYEGQAAAYDLRYDTEPITEESWEEAIEAGGEPAPDPAGSPEAFTVEGLEAETTYYFAIRVADEVPHWSELSNGASGTTPAPDRIPPASVEDLLVTETAPTSAVLAWTAVGDDGTDGLATAYDLRFALAPITDATWGAATQVNGEPVPAPPGTQEACIVEDLAPETTYYFAIRVADEIGRWSGLSNVAHGMTPAPPPDELPPGPVTTLEIGAVEQNAVTLTWIAVGDDGNEGVAAVYDLRCAAFPIDSDNWDEATACTGEPTPGPAGSSEEFTAEDLEAGTTYYFAMRVADEVPNWSVLSGVASATTEPPPDELPPAAIGDLRAERILHREVALGWTAPADDEETEGAAAYEGRMHQAPIDEENWADAAPLADLPVPSAPGATDSVAIGGLEPASHYYFAIRAIDEAENIGAIGAVLEVTTTSAPDTLPPARIDDLAATDASITSVTLQWHAPADSIPADCVEVPEIERYEIRFATDPLDDESWETGVLVEPPEPAEPGTLQEVIVTGLLVETSYYFAIRAVDPRGNWSQISNAVEQETEPHEELPDVLDPGPIVDLSARAPRYNQALLIWTAPGGDGSEGQADHYDIRWSYDVIIGGAWSEAAPILPAKACAAAGEPETLLVEGLEPLTTYHFAMRAIDAAGNLGPVSGSVSTRTPIGPDVVAPAVVTNLAAIERDTSSVVLRWTAPQDDRGRCAAYELRYTTNGIDAANWESADPVDGVAAPRDPGTVETARVTGLAAGTRFSFGLRARDEAGNLSDMSNVVWVTTISPDEPQEDSTAPARIDDLAATAVSEAEIRLTWTAVGDDGVEGSATAYELRHSLAPIDGSNWTEAAPVSVPFVPAKAGQREEMVVTGMEPDTDHYFAVRACDDRGNLSPCSPAAKAHTPEALDTQAPMAPVGLLVAAVADRVVLQWGGSPDPDVADYILYRRETGGAADETVAFLGIRGTAFEDAVVLPEVEYAYSVAARDGAGNISPKSAEVVVRTRLEGFLPEIDDFEGRCVVERPAESEPAQLRLSWTATAGDRFAGFIVERSEDDGASWQRRNAELLAGQAEYAFVEAIEAGTYLYRVAAVSPRGYQRQFDPMVVRWIGESQRLAVDGPYPNPSRGDVGLRFYLGTEETVNVRLYDLSGRMICVLCDEIMPAGMHPWKGDAVGVDGAPLAAGVYFLGIQAGEERVVRKLVVRN